MRAPTNAHRSQVTNGRRLVPGVDARGALLRRFRDLVQALGDEVGGYTRLSESGRALVRQAAACTLRAEQMQKAMVTGDVIAPDELIRLSSECRRMVEAVRSAAPVQPAARSTLRDHLQRAQSAA